MMQNAVFIVLLENSVAKLLFSKIISNLQRLALFCRKIWINNNVLPVMICSARDYRSLIQRICIICRFSRVFLHKRFFF